MIILLSPAKTLDYKTKPSVYESSLPIFQKQAESIASEMRKYSAKQISELMEISMDLAQLNFERYQNWNKDETMTPLKQAIYAYKGDVYLGLNAYKWENDKIDFAQQNLRILSGLYGYLKPLDLIKPYRLEMGTKVKIKTQPDLYHFWRNRITKAVIVDSDNLNSNYIINLASAEYSSVIDYKKLNLKVISPQFLDFKNGTYKMISFFAKKARGMMASYLCGNKITNAEDIIGFSQDGYMYNPQLSLEDKPVFTR
ncbi:MAG: hypothetical protein FD155_2025 [Bacteroidetes bacterium]|nr:MAG: hypothetical protein FD155_2025 [Bacteroidota bacterium]